MPSIAAAAAPPDTLDGLAERIGQAFARLDRGAQECNLARLEAAGLLVEARRRVLAAREADPTRPGFRRWCALHVRRSWRDVQRLVRIGEASSPRAALERERAVNRAAQQATRRRAPRTVRPAHVTDAPAPPSVQELMAGTDDSMIAPVRADSFVAWALADSQASASAPAREAATRQSLASGYGLYGRAVTVPEAPAPDMLSPSQQEPCATIIEAVRQLPPYVRRLILHILAATSDAERRLIQRMLEELQ